MNVQTLMILLVFVVFSYFLAIKFLKKTGRVILVCLLTGLWGGMVVVTILHFGNHTFRLAFDARFAQEKYFVDRSNGQQLPLPEHTALNFRSSDKQATYYTTKSAAEIFDFYKALASDSLLSNIKEQSLLVSRNGEQYQIKVEESEQPSGQFISIVSK